LTFEEMTAFFLSCFVPTLFRGNAWIAATLVPASATPRAIQAITIAGDGRSQTSRFMILLEVWRR
jgi:poly(3-hydroxybutyrate) depolymerase